MCRTKTEISHKSAEEKIQDSVDLCVYMNT